MNYEKSELFHKHQDKDVAIIIENNEFLGCVKVSQECKAFAIKRGSIEQTICGILVQSMHYYSEIQGNQLPNQEKTWRKLK